jgi:hypothetical protein
VVIQPVQPPVQRYEGVLYDVFGGGPVSEARLFP